MADSKGMLGIERGTATFSHHEHGNLRALTPQSRGTVAVQTHKSPSE